ncbi:hypothetical protein DFJ74DRAFT_660303 [Hyaloraphidium curvatum]|nr:hypothetical protein DFJ74DRAFT_660303 [Hyaloraphidium curvatum]
MAKAAKSSTTKSGAPKEKRPSTPWNNFVSSRLKDIKAAHPGWTHKEAMEHLGGIWKNAPENPKRGK